MTDEPQSWQMVLVELYSLVEASGYRAIAEHASRSGVAGPLSKSTVGDLVTGKAPSDPHGPVKAASSDEPAEFSVGYSR